MVYGSFAIITNEVLYQLSYSGILLCFGPTMALLNRSQAPQVTGFAYHSGADPTIAKQLLYQLNYSDCTIELMVRRRVFKTPKKNLYNKY